MPATRHHDLRDERINAYSRLVETQRRLHRLFDRRLRSEAGISIVWYEALLRLARAPEGHLPINELGEAMELSSGGATRLVDRLEEEGYVDRRPCPTDRRVSRVAISDRGREVLDSATGVHLEDLEVNFASRLSAADMDTLRDLLRRLRPEE